MNFIVQPIASRPDAGGRVLMGLCAVAAAYATFAGSIPANPEIVWLSVWQRLGFAFFSGLFLLLALRPRLSAGVWELCFINKAGLFVVSLFVSSAPGAAEAGLFDGILAVVIAIPYGLTRGWEAWGNRKSA